jgi:hypothetical protein
MNILIVVIADQQIPRSSSMISKGTDATSSSTTFLLTSTYGQFDQNVNVAEIDVEATDFTGREC